MEFWVALLPIAVIVVGMAGLNYPSKVMAPVGWVIALASSFFLFAAPIDKLLATSWAGALDGARVVWLIWAAFTLLQVMLKSGKMDDIKMGLADMTMDKRLMVLLLAIPFGTFIEGASGAGTPAAIAAPFLVALGMNPVVAAAACLIGNSAPVSWGGAGVTTVVGAGGFPEIFSFAQASAMTGRYAALEYVILPVIMISFVFGLRALKGIGKDILFVGVMMGVINFTVSNLLIPVTELTSLLGGLIGTIVFSYYLKCTRKTDVPEEYMLVSSGLKKVEGGTLLFALSPYIIVCAMLVVVRLSVPLKFLIGFGGGYTVWVGCVVFVCALVAAIIFRSAGEFPKAVGGSFMKVIPALLAMAFLMAMVNTLKLSGQITAMAKTLSVAAGSFYPAVAVLIGQVGGFVTGTNLGSNLMFNPLHVEAAKNLGLNVVTVVAAQNTGGAIGNMICPNNVVAVCACVSILGKEGEVMRKTLLPSMILLVFLGALAMLYTYVVFPI